MDLRAMDHEIIEQIQQLEEERRQIYADSQVDEREHPRLTDIVKELERLWDLRRRIEAAQAAGLDSIPIPPPSDPAQLIG
jgi:septal ring factor EnvC (AmiA/AmiB activator)